MTKIEDNGQKWDFWPKLAIFDQKLAKMAKSRIFSKISKTTFSSPDG